MKSGFVSIIGRPNAGKSSILNAILQQKVAIVSPKPQTTRQKINGILTTQDFQIIFTDTPGLNKPKNVLGEYMQKDALSAVSGVDVIMLVIDCKHGIEPPDHKLILQYSNQKTPLIVVLNKIDLTTFEKLYPKIDMLIKQGGIAEILCVSARTKKNIDLLVPAILKYLPQGPMFYPVDEVCDKPVRFLVAEIIREKALLFLQDEIPHGIGVSISKMHEGEVCHIEADIFAEKENHKQIVIGQNGAMLKKIGSSARIDIEKLLECKVNLKLFVKVRNDWRNDTLIMADIGYKREK